MRPHAAEDDVSTAAGTAAGSDVEGAANAQCECRPGVDINRTPDRSCGSQANSAANALSSEARRGVGDELGDAKRGWGQRFRDLQDAISSHVRSSAARVVSAISPRLVWSACRFPSTDIGVP
jgi:hypothetical protein